MPDEPGHCHLITGRGGKGWTRWSAGERLGFRRGGGGGSRDGFKDHYCMLLVPAEEMRTACVPATRGAQSHRLCMAGDGDNVLHMEFADA